METKCRSFGIERVKKRLNMHGLAVDSRGKGGGLALLWDKEVFVDLVSFSRYHMDARVQLREGEDYWRFTVSTVNPTLVNELYLGISSDVLVGFLIFLGYASETIMLFCLTQKRKGLSRLLNGNSALFAKLLATVVCMMEHPFTVRKRLDRACVNLSWTTRWPATVTQHLDRIYSDHAPIITVREKQCEKWAEVGGRPKRFEALWIKSKDCETVISNLWNNSPGDFDLTNDFASRLENCKLGLLNWSRSEFGHISKRIEFLEHEIASIQSSAITRTSRERLSSLKAELESLLSAEEIKWKQRGKAAWLSEGDRNTAFFHAKASHRRKINHIDRIRDETGCWCDEPASIQGVIQRYFHTIFTSARPTREELNEVIETVPTRVTSEMNRKLLEDYSAEEVKAALIQMFPFKSPGPDGMPQFFFNAFGTLLEMLPLLLSSNYLMISHSILL
ncbi:UNVERIFIED_CONTAM: hypothetical protein Sangu_2238700 [Sesamum angustifolium]|uniref:Reverse transcriptase n=1 Tax=Sesamum angustifolium TaxID=2727405 RepID=A0AAW2L785_9LAMI